MTASLNEVNLIGNLCRDPESRTTQAAKQIVNLTIATSESWKDATGERKEKSEYHRVVIFSEGLAKVASSYLKKGSKVFLRGQLQTRKWTDQAGVEKYSTEVVLQGFNSVLLMLDGKSSEGASGGGGYNQSYSAPSGGGNAGYSGGSAKQPASSMLLDDEIPFAWLLAMGTATIMAAMHYSQFLYA